MCSGTYHIKDTYSYSCHYLCPISVKPLLGYCSNHIPVIIPTREGSIYSGVATEPVVHFENVPHRHTLLNPSFSLETYILIPY